MMFGRGYNVYSSCFGDGSRSGFWFGGWGMMIIGVIILVAVTAIIITLVRNSRNRPRNEAVESLKLRLAKGEINEEEYLRRKSILD